MTMAAPANDPTLAYYEDQAEGFFAETVEVATAPLYARFLAVFRPAGRSLMRAVGRRVMRPVEFQRFQEVD